jgi:hypothetical protein
MNGSVQVDGFGSKKAKITPAMVGITWNRVGIDRLAFFPSQCHHDSSGYLFGCEV